jgi:hypothetical protein
MQEGVPLDVWGDGRNYVEPMLSRPRAAFAAAFACTAHPFSDGKILERAGSFFFLLRHPQRSCGLVVFGAFGLQ